jgi:hypothetical protein
MFKSEATNLAHLPSLPLGGEWFVRHCVSEVTWQKLKTWQKLLVVGPTCALNFIIILDFKESMDVLILHGMTDEWTRVRCGSSSVI